MVRFHPQWLRARELVRERPHRHAARRADVSSATSTSIRPTSATTPTSAAADCTTSAATRSSAGRYFFDAEPLRGDRAHRPRSGVSHRSTHQRPCSISATVAASISPFRRRSRPTSASSFAAPRAGSSSPIPFNAPQGATTRISIDDGGSLDGAGIVTETLPESDQYQLQGEAFSRAVRGEIALEHGVEDAIANMRVDRCAVPIRAKRAVGSGVTRVTTRTPEAAERMT